MENIFSDLQYRQETLDSSQLTRLKPPLRTGIYEDLGSSFKPSQSKSPQKKKRMGRKHSPTSDFGSEESEDEMDVLSQSTEADERIVTGGPKSSGGHILPAYHLDVLENRSKTLKGLKFSKTKVPAKATEKKATPSPPRSKSQTKPKESRQRSGTENDSNDEGIYMNTRKPKSTPSIMNVDTTARPKPRPRPRPIVKLPTAHEFPGPSLDTPTNAPLKRTLTSIPLPSPLSNKINTTVQTSPRLSANTSSSSSSNTSNASSSSHPPPPDSSSSKASSSKSGLRRPQKFPSFSPLNSPTEKRRAVAAAKTFPDLSPLSKDKKPEKGKPRDKGKRKATSRGLQPFPMSTQDLGDISASSGEDSDTDRHTRKRRYQGDERLSALDHMDVYEEEDSLFMSPAVDPKTLCPYCDAPLPVFPTPFLKRLLAATAEKSHPDPRSTNPLGRKAPLSTFVTVCQRHRFESEILPEAETKDWPKSIDWEQLGGRIAVMKLDLQGIIDDPGDADMSIEIQGEEEENDLMTNFIGKGPRMQCVFWREAMKAIKLRGSRAVAGVKGQYLDFEKIQPGYYGELGSMIIHQTLLSMFPLDTFGSKTITPFTANEFIQRILVPEVALRLIIEDRGLKGLIGAETALEVLRESTAYGVVMFPEDGGDGSKKFGVGDRIVMERAQKRRKEIEEGTEMEVMEELPQNPQRSETEEGEDQGQLQAPGGGSELHKTKKASRGSRGQLSRKGSKTGEESDAISVDSLSDKNDVESSARNHESVAVTRPRRAIKTVNYVDTSDDDQRSDRSKSRNSRPSRTKTRTKVVSRSPSFTERPLSRVDKNSYISLLSQTDTNSTEEDTDGKGRKEVSQRESPTKKSVSKRPVSKHQRSIEVNELDLNTPMPKRRGQQIAVEGGDSDPTPRPARKDLPTPLRPQESLLVQLRARKQDSKETESTTRSDSEALWTYNMRAIIPEDSGSSSPSDISEPTITKPKRRKKRVETREESYTWLLSDPSSQETRSPRKASRR